MSAPRPPPSNTNSPNGAPPAKRRRPAKKQGLRAPAAAPSSVPTGLSSTTSTPIDTPSMTPGTLTPPATSGGEGGRGFTNTRFADFLAQGAISQACMNGIASLRPVHEFCTEVQAATLPVILTGADVLAQARTGTGKTLAFLIPSIESLLRAKPQPAAGHISILILSPTRELAIQIEEAARGLLSGTNYAVQHVVGGTNMNSEINRLNKQRCDILVATPGRILDHLENSNLRSKLVACRALILDEADRLLEQGFRKEIVKIIECLPDRRQVPRQTLLFSATVPAQVHQIASLALLPNFTFITTLKPEEENTHKHVPQFSLIAPLEDQFATTLGAIKSELATHGAATKIMVFFPTARATGLAAALFKRCNIGLEIWEIHSRKSQSQRNAAAESYKLAKSGVLFSSDVTARGMDFPGVTTVIQTGLPQNTEQYVHRLGRTARAGASGSGIIILAPFEAFFLRKRDIASLPLSAHPLSTSTLATASPQMQALRLETQKAMSTVDDESKSQFYSASLGFFKASLRDCFGGNADTMVATFNAYAVSPWGLAYNGASGEIPGMLASTIGKMGLKGVQGLRIVKELPGKEGQSNGRGGGGGGRGGGGGGGGRGGARGGGRGGAGAGRGGSRGGRGRGGF